MLIAPRLNCDLIKTGNMGGTRDYTEVMMDASDSIQVKTPIQDLILKKKIGIIWARVACVSLCAPSEARRGRWVSWN